MPFFLPAIISGVGAALGGIGQQKQRQSQVPANLQDRYRYGVLEQMQHNPLAPYEKLRRGKMYAAFARAWGLGDILGEQFLDHISDANSVPGTDAIGGAANLRGPGVTGIPAGERQGGGFNMAGAILGGLGAGLGAYGGGGGGGGYVQNRANPNDFRLQTPGF